MVESYRPEVKHCSVRVSPATSVCSGLGGITILTGCSWDVASACDMSCDLGVPGKVGMTYVHD